MTDPARARPAAPGLRVATANTRHGVGTDGRLDPARLARALGALGADVLGLQEVDRRFGARSAGADQARLLAEALGMHLAWGRALASPAFPDDPEAGYGVALLTREPAGPVAVRPLPGERGGEPRVLLEAAVPVGGGHEVRVLVTHLDAASATARRAQAAAIGAPDPARGPAVLLGDLNAAPGSPDLAGLTAWTDAWRAAPGRRGGAWPLPAAAAAWLPVRLGGRTSPAATPLRRLDAVLVAGGPVVLRAEVAGRGPRPGRGRGWPSDHRALVVDLALPDR